MKSMGFQKGHKLNIGNQYAKGIKHTEEWKSKVIDCIVPHLN